ncbi:MAG TPA: SDR family NAD(P)-dependent oxidoreductase [Nocardioidaceae bacterium]|nr:SDR family NAD(P)-dependent oxidoreductase [Nocardioidaceae bacterium]
MTADAQTRRVVLVTGASSGIGRATAHRLADRGDVLVLASRSADTLEEVRQECVARGAADVLVVPTDVGDRDAVEELLDTVTRTHGRVDGVVHSAAVLAYGRFEDVPAEVFDRTVTTNVTGTANVARGALRAFRDQDGGSLVVVGSVLGKMTSAFMSPYATSKWAVHGLVRTLQIEARQTPGVDITLVSPGGVNTPIYNLAGSYTGRTGQPPPPVDPPEKVAAAIVEALESPRREVSVGLANPLMVLAFRLLPAVFDGLVTPLMRRLGQSRGRVEAGPGNVLEPADEGYGVHGDWPSRFHL